MENYNQKIISSNPSVCFTEKMLVKCLGGYKKISDITTDDYVLTEDGSYQRVYSTQKTSYNSKLTGMKVYGINKTILSTPDHPFLTKDRGYVKASEITHDDYLGIPLNKKEIFPTFSPDLDNILTNSDFWFLMGYFLGDGKIDEGIISITIDDENMRNIPSTIGRTISLNPIKDDIKEKKYTMKILENNLIEFFSMFGGIGRERKIPDFIYDAPVIFVEKFLNGLVMSDGFLDTNGTTISTISHDVAYGVQLLYMKLGIRASIYSQKENKIFTVNISKQKNKSKKFIFDEKYLWLKIKDVKDVVDKKIGGFVYNLSVENNNTYNVFNIINHNCNQN